jgi:hypothetical protein
VVPRRVGYETPVKGKDGFLCMVQRSWAAASPQKLKGGDVRVRGGGSPVDLLGAARRHVVSRLQKILY